MESNVPLINNKHIIYMHVQVHAWLTSMTFCLLTAGPELVRPDYFSHKRSFRDKHPYSIWIWTVMMQPGFGVGWHYIDCVTSNMTIIRQHIAVSLLPTRYQSWMCHDRVTILLVKSYLPLSIMMPLSNLEKILYLWAQYFLISGSLRI